MDDQRNEEPKRINKRSVNRVRQARKICKNLSTPPRWYTCWTGDTSRRTTPQNALVEQVPAWLPSSGFFSIYLFIYLRMESEQSQNDIPRRLRARVRWFGCDRIREKTSLTGIGIYEFFCAGTFALPHRTWWVLFSNIDSSLLLLWSKQQTKNHVGSYQLNQHKNRQANAISNE